MTGFHNVTVWGWFWLGWMATALIAEVYWLIVNSANTLSREIWGVEGMNFAHPLDLAHWTPLHWAITVALWLFFAWLSVHFAFGWLR